MPVEAKAFTGRPEEWDGFVQDHPEATFFHQHGWLQLIRDVYGGTPHYLAARDQGQIAGILPLLRRRLMGCGPILVSVPYADEGGLCATTAEGERALLTAADALGRETGANYVELRQLDRSPQDDLPSDNTRVILRMPLPPSVEELQRSLSSNMRKKVRRAGRDGLSAHDGGREGVRPFYHVYVRNMRDLGSPMHSLRFFEALFDRFPEAVLTVLIKRGEAVAGAAVAVQFRDVLTVLCAHSLRSYHKLFPNNLLYWRLFEVAIERGCTVADFGRSPRGSGIYEFKKLWGMEDHQLCCSILPLRRTPKLGERRDSVAYRIFSRIWQGVPIPVARVIGPAVFARLPL